MADLSDDDDVGVQNACEDVDEVQVIDESEQAEFFEALLHHYSDPSRPCCTIILILLCSLSKEWRP